MSNPKDRASEPSRRYVAKGIDRLDEPALSMRPLD
jgi:hypothetical protein